MSNDIKIVVNEHLYEHSDIGRELLINEQLAIVDKEVIDNIIDKDTIDDELFAKKIEREEYEKVKKDRKDKADAIVSNIKIHNVSYQLTPLLNKIDNQDCTAKKVVWIENNYFNFGTIISNRGITCDVKTVFVESKKIGDKLTVYEPNWNKPKKIRMIKIDNESEQLYLYDNTTTYQKILVLA